MTSGSPGRLAALLLAVFVVGIVLQLWFAGELRELEALGHDAPAAALERAWRLFWVGGAATFGAALGFAALLGSIAARALRAGAFPPPGAEWLGARRSYQGAAARRVGWGGIVLSALLGLASLAGLALTAVLGGLLGA